MGTNYYYHANPVEAIAAEVLGNREGRHIGKSSAGWCFSLHTYPDDEIRGLEDWLKLLSAPLAVIKDEYGSTIPFKEMRQIITERSWGGGVPFNQRFKPEQESLGHYLDVEDFHRKNYSTEGPNGLLRHKVDSSRGVTHGEGTWDNCPYEFC